MSVAAISMCKDEADVARGLVEHTLAHVDLMIVADNGSTDGTRDVLGGLARAYGNLVLLDDPEPAYMQSDKMTLLADLAAREFGAHWIVPVDFDELWGCPGGHLLRDVLPGLPHPVVIARLYNHIRTTCDEPDPDPFASMVWRQDMPGALDKVAFRWQPGARVHQGNHGVDLPSAPLGGLQVAQVRHFPVRSRSQYESKALNGAAAYAAAGDRLPDSFGAHWRGWGAMTVEQRDEAYARYWVKTPPECGGPVPAADEIRLVRDPAPYLGGVVKTTPGVYVPVPD